MDNHLERRRRIHHIESTRKVPPHLPRACAYVRVSTAHEEQKHSLENQKQYYTNLLGSRPDIVFCGVFCDDGISGDRTNRPGFQSMMEEARNGRIDIIYTKSISRFARNTVLLLNSIRELKACGVAVFFEEQSIHTLHAEGELLLSVLGSVAEEERRNTSANIQWTYRSRFQHGDTGIISKCPYGYSRQRGGTLTIDAAQAKVVRRIFRQYLKGTSTSQISQELNDLDVPTETGHVWSSQRILRILSNEKYMGDFRTQKTFVSDSGIAKINRGQLAQYYVTDSHKGIISRREWEAAQRLREERKPKSYPWTGKLKCRSAGLR